MILLNRNNLNLLMLESYLLIVEIVLLCLHKLVVVIYNLVKKKSID